MAEEDQEWCEEAAKAREVARSQGIDQETIDRVIYDARRGRVGEKAKGAI